MLRNIQLIPGLIFALILSNSVLPVRIMQGQANNMVNLVGSQFVIFILCLCCWILSIAVLQSSGLRQGGKLCFSMLGCAVLSIIFYYGSNPFFEDFPLDPLTNHSIYVGVSRMAYRGIIIGIILFPSAYFLETQRRLHFHRLILEQRKQQNLLAELNYFRQQMNPHFLFNALNILKSGTDEEWIKKYIIQLSEVYRYFLNHPYDTVLIELSEELTFIKNYAAILKHRFGDGLDINLQVNSKLTDKCIPPLSIQILIENAIQHNAVSSSDPLQIEIREEGGHIVVSNTKKKRFSDGHHTSGLNDLTERYRLLSSKPVIIEQNEDFFIVKLPFLSK